MCHSSMTHLQNSHQAMVLMQGNHTAPLFPEKHGSMQLYTIQLTRTRCLMHDLLKRCHKTDIYCSPLDACNLLQNA